MGKAKRNCKKNFRGRFQRTCSESGKSLRGKIAKREQKNKTKREVNDRTPWLVLVCVYLCVVPDIEAQTDKAGFELLGAQRARVILGVRAVVRGQQRGHAAHTCGG